ncbi:hypothetical protein OAN10_03740 [Alphaproteobacteria bacterium]|nr:hypothetical protein [Alphaproteobacteria bacterium]
MIEYEKKIAQQTLQVLKKKSWSAFSLEQILKKIKVKKTNIKTKFDLLKTISKYVDYLLIEKTKSLENSTPKDMLFEVLMARFDILEENRKAFLEIYKILKKNPKQLLKLLPTFLESMIITAELSKHKVNGLKGAIRLKGLMLIYFITFFQWVEDKDSSLEKTMTALDKNLDQAEKLSKLFL